MCLLAKVSLPRSLRLAVLLWSLTMVRSPPRVEEALAAMPDVADKIRAGKVQAAGAIVGQVMEGYPRPGGCGSRA